MDEQHLQCEVSTTDGVTQIVPCGDIDMSRSAEFRVVIKPAVEAKPKKIIVDLQFVPYMDSSGIATLIEGLQLSKQENISFLLCSLSEGVQSIVELARLDKIFTIYTNIEEAIAE